MSSTLMYNTGNQHLREVTEADIDRLREEGWKVVHKHELIAVYSPSLGEHKTVLRADVKTWLNLGYYAEPTMVFHPHQGSITVSAEEAKHLLENGWYDSPAAFPKEDANAVVERAVKAFKEESGVTTSFAQPEKPLYKMTKAELIAHALSLGLNLSPDNMTNQQIVDAITAAKEGA